MKRPIVSSGRPQLAEATAYMRLAKGDELRRARARARSQPARRPDKLLDALEVHHALFLLRRAQGWGAPSYDDVRVELRRRACSPPDERAAR
ncbi:MAG: hypothetical protein U0235_12075 [Polyangiaceae bacterium]